MAKSAETPKAETPKTETIEKVVSVYKKTESISKTALQTEISTTKVRKILITEGLWSSARSQQIRELADQGKSSSEIAENLQINIAMVQNYLPYEKGLYDEPEKTDTAIRSEKYRKRNRTYAQKSRAREQQTIDSLGTVQETAAPGEKKTHLPCSCIWNCETAGLIPCLPMKQKSLQNTEPLQSPFPGMSSSHLP